MDKKEKVKNDLDQLLGRVAGDDSDIDWHQELVEEMRQYQQFLKLTGIRASRPERVAIAKLLVNHPFTIKQVRRVWDNQSLFYEDARLKVKVPKIEPIIGWLVFGYGLLVMSPLPITLIFGNPKPLQSVAMWAAFVAALLAVTLMARQFVLPAVTAKKMKPIVEGM